MGYRSLVTRAGTVSQGECFHPRSGSTRMTADLHFCAPVVPVLDGAPGPSKKRARDSLHVGQSGMERVINPLRIQAHRPRLASRGRPVGTYPLHACALLTPTYTR